MKQCCSLLFRARRLGNRERAAQASVYRRRRHMWLMLGRLDVWIGPSLVKSLECLGGISFVLASTEAMASTPRWRPNVLSARQSACKNMMYTI